MSDMHDPDRIAPQIDKLRRLRGRERRVALLRRSVRRRVDSRQEPDGLARVPLRLINTLPSARRQLDPVLVVPGEILVPASARDAAQRILRDARLLEDQATPDAAAETDGRARSAVVRIGSSVDVRIALELLRDNDVRASANHVAAMGGRAKGGNTPRATTVDLGQRPTTTIDPHPLVVVIDTGVDRAAIGDAVLAARNRSDGWLDGVVAHTSSDGLGNGIDLLDTSDYHGNVGADGFLDLGAGHGTFVAGVIRRLAPTANIVMIRALDTDGYGSETMIERAIDHANDLFVDAGGPGLLNLSLGLETVDGGEPTGISRAIGDLPDSVRVVAAAGNGDTGIPVWPGALERDPGPDRDPVLGVASVMRSDTGELVGCDWSNRGPWVDFSAPGESVISTFVAGTETEGSGDLDDPFESDPDTFVVPNPYAAWSGTSFSAAKVTGALAAYLIKNPGAQIEQAVAHLRQEATDLNGSGFGYGLDL